MYSHGRQLWPGVDGRTGYNDSYGLHSSYGLNSYGLCSYGQAWMAGRAMMIVMAYIVVMA